MSLSSTPTYPTRGVEVSIKTDTGAEPLNVEELKSYIGESSTSRDAELQLIIAAAREAVERKYLISLKPKTYTVYVREPGTEVEVPHPPTVSVSEAVQVDNEGTEKGLELNADYFTYGVDALFLRFTDTSYPVKFEALSGPAAISAGQKWALMNLCKLMYDGQWMPGEKIPNDIHATFASYGRHKW
jgi:hypothetical protein